MEPTVCPNCGTAATEGNKFCSACGTELNPTPAPPASVCPTCAQAVEAEQKFCGMCGAKLDPPAPDASAATETEGDRTTADLRPPGLGARVEAGKPPVSPAGDDTPSAAPPKLDKPRTLGALRLILPGDRDRDYPLDKEVTIIGKDPHSDITLSSDAYASHTHARVVVRDGQYFLEDLSSRNGTFVQTHGAVRLCHGDRLLIGATILEFQEVPSEKVAAASKRP